MNVKILGKIAIQDPSGKGLAMMSRAHLWAYIIRLAGTIAVWLGSRVTPRRDDPRQGFPILCDLSLTKRLKFELSDRLRLDHAGFA